MAAQLATQTWSRQQGAPLCLVLENTFTSLPDIGRYLFDLRVLHFLPDWVHKNKVGSGGSRQGGVGCKRVGV